MCSVSGCHEVPSPACVVGTCAAGYIHPQCCLHFERARTSSKSQPRHLPQHSFIALFIASEGRANSTHAHMTRDREPGGPVILHVDSASPPLTFGDGGCDISQRKIGSICCLRCSHLRRSMACASQRCSLVILPRLLLNQPYSYDSPSESGGREAGLFVNSGVSSPMCHEFLLCQFGVGFSQKLYTSVPSTPCGCCRGRPCAVWAAVGGSGQACACFSSSSHGDAGDANVCHLHFTLCRSRSVDNMIPCTDLLLSLCSRVATVVTRPPTKHAQPSNSFVLQVRQLLFVFMMVTLAAVTLLLLPPKFPRAEVSDSPNSIPLLRDWRPTLRV